MVEYQIKEEIDIDSIQGDPYGNSNQEEDHLEYQDLDYEYNEENTKNLNTTKKEFKCEFCEKAYTSSGALKYHLEKVHEGKKMEIKKFKCTYCKKSYSGRSPLKYHISRCHNENQLEPHEEYQLEQDYDLEYDVDNLDTTQ